IEGTNGLLYSTTIDGGISHNGTVFAIDKSGSNFNVIHYFTGGTNGFEPTTSLLKGPNGKLYGTTSTGGTHNNGVAFILDYNGSNYLVLHHFGGTGDGSQPSNLILAPDGNLYGATYFSGGVFQMDASGNNYGLPVLLSGTNGANPNPLIVG